MFKLLLILYFEKVLDFNITERFDHVGKSINFVFVLLGDFRKGVLNVWILEILESSGNSRKAGSNEKDGFHI